MKALIPCLLCCAFSAPALSQPSQPWEGYWASNAAYCANAGETGEQTPDHYSREGFFGLEWSCDIAELRRTGFRDSWSIKLACMDAGYEYTEERLMLLTMEDRLLFIDRRGVMANMVRCADPAAR